MPEATGFSQEALAAAQLPQTGDFQLSSVPIQNLAASAYQQAVSLSSADPTGGIVA